MTLISLLALLAAGTGEPAPILVAATSTAIPARQQALPSFAPSLAGRPLADRPTLWLKGNNQAAWKAIMRSTPDQRQQARWTYALTLIGNGLAGEALGVLDVMAQDDRDLTLSPVFQLARGNALTRLGRTADAFDALAHPALLGNAEACAWRMMALANGGAAKDALAQWNCALPAINARHGKERRPFLLAGAASALRDGKAAQARRWLDLLPDNDAQANLLRGHALAKLGRLYEASTAYGQAAAAPDLKTRLDAQLSSAETLVAANKTKPALALKVSENVRYRWRGGPLELRALKLSYQLADRINEDRTALAAGATLLRYYPQSTDSAQMLVSLQERLARALAPESKVPLIKAGGLFWDFRDIIPAGASGDKLASDLAYRLQDARLYARAADLLNHMLRTRVSDISQGPLSVRVAILYILSGEPKRALMALTDTDATPFPDEMRWDRQRIEAVALSQLGRDDEALAVLDSVPGSGAITAEILWRQQNWQALAGGSMVAMPDPGPLNDVEQAIVMRRAVALAMIGDEKGLADLRGEYGASFAALPNGQAFALLTGPVTGLDPEAVAAAMASIPSASPAGAYGDLLALTAVKKAAKS